MNNLKAPLLLIGLCCGLQATAQVSGQVTDERSNPLEFVNIVLLALPDSVYINGTINDGNGRFSFRESPEGKMVKISSVGYSTVYKGCSNGDLGTIPLFQAAHELAAVEIKASLPRTRIKGHALVTTVQNSVLSKAGSANDVLSKIPGILVKRNSAFEVFGKGTPLIYINGRQVTDMPELEQLNMNYRHKGLDAFGTFSFSKNAFKRDSKIEQTVWVDTLWKQKNENQLRSDSKKYQGIAGVNYSINQFHSLGARYTISVVPQFNDYGITESLIEADGAFYDKWYNDQKNTTRTDPTHQLNLYYNGKVNKLSVNWNADGYMQNKRVSSYTKEKSLEKDDYVNAENYVPASSSLIEERAVNAFADYSLSAAFGKLAFGMRYEHLLARKTEYPKRQHPKIILEEGVKHRNESE